MKIARILLWRPYLVSQLQEQFALTETRGG